MNQQVPNTGSYFSTIFGSSFDQTSRSGTGNKTSESNPNDIPKEELLQLCMKLNKRMQALESKHTDLIAKYKSLNQEKNTLLDLIRNSLTVPITEIDDIVAIGEIWRKQYQEERDHQQKLEEELKLLKSSHSESPEPQDEVIMITLFCDLIML